MIIQLFGGLSDKFMVSVLAFAVFFQHPTYTCLRVSVCDSAILVSRSLCQDDARGVEICGMNMISEMRICRLADNFWVAFYFLFFIGGRTSIIRRNSGLFAILFPPLFVIYT